MIVETGTAEQLFARPRHPYTLGLLQSVPRLDAGRKQRLQPIEGQPRDMLRPPRECPFARAAATRSSSHDVRFRALRRSSRTSRRVLQPGRRGRVGPDAVGGDGVSDSAGSSALVEIDGLKVYFPIKSGLVLDRHIGDIKAVDGISLTIERGGRSVSSASRAAASRRSDARSSASTSRPKGGSSSTDRTSRTCPRASCGRFAGACR